ncbi:MAG: UDP-glucose 4-epimerase GalE [Pseudomonadota bacterium]
MSVLVTEGAGYLGSHILLALEEAGLPAIAVDDLLNGAVWLVPDPSRLVIGDLGDENFIKRVIDDYAVTDVIHISGSINPSTSLKKPVLHYERNVSNTLSLLRACLDRRVQRVILSSTASVYGRPERTPVDETAPVQSLTPYGASMAMAERILTDVAAAGDIAYSILRYFNVAGSDAALRAGQIGKANNLIRVAAQIAAGARREDLLIFGTDYPTPDGTAIRDYVHVTDLADAHVAALSALKEGNASKIYNCGYGRGYSVHEVINAVERVSGLSLPTQNAPRRSGDPPQLIADSAAIRGELDWRPRFDELDIIVRSSIAWEQRLHNA